MGFIKDLSGNISAKNWTENPQKTQTSGFRSIQAMHVVFSLDYLKYLHCRDLPFQKAAIKFLIPFKTDANTPFCFSLLLFSPALTAHSSMGNEPDQVGSALPRAAQQFDEQLLFPCGSRSSTVGRNVRNPLPVSWMRQVAWMSEAICQSVLVIRGGAFELLPPSVLEKEKQQFKYP